MTTTKIVVLPYDEIVCPCGERGIYIVYEGDDLYGFVALQNYMVCPTCGNVTEFDNAVPNLNQEIDV